MKEEIKRKFGLETKRFPCSIVYLLLVSKSTVKDLNGEEELFGRLAETSGLIYLVVKCLLYSTRVGSFVRKTAKAYSLRGSLFFRKRVSSSSGVCVCVLHFYIDIQLALSCEQFSPRVKNCIFFHLLYTHKETRKVVDLSSVNESILVN